MVGFGQGLTFVWELMPVQVSQPMVHPWENQRLGRRQATRGKGQTARLRCRLVWDREALAHHGWPPPDARTPASQPLAPSPQLQLPPPIGFLPFSTVVHTKKIVR